LTIAKKPRNFHELASPSCSAQGHNPLCGDQLKLFVALDGDVINDISFVGVGLLHLESVRFAADGERQRKKQGRRAENVRPGP